MASISSINTKQGACRKKERILITYIAKVINENSTL
jgi:hypothetical protein